MSRLALTPVLCLFFFELATAQDASRIKEYADYLKQGDGKAAFELVKFGAAAVPALIDVLKEGDALARGRAAQALGAIGPAAKESALVLAGALGDNDVAIASQAGAALGQIGPAAVPALLKVLKEPNTDIALVRAAQAAGRIGLEAKEAVPLIALALKSASAPENRAALIGALGQIGPAAASAVPALLESLKDQKMTPLLQTQLTIHTAVALGQIGPAAKAAVPALVEIVKNAKEPGDPVRFHALEALGQIGAPAQDIAPIVVEMLKAGNPGPRLVLLETLAKIGVPTKESFPALSQGLRDKDVYLRIYSAKLIGKMEPNNPAVVSVLIEALQEKDAALRRLAAEFLGQLRPRDGALPTIGSWINYGLGTLNQNLPQYVVLGTPTGDCCGGSWTHGADYLGAEYAGVRLNVGAANPLPFVAPAAGLEWAEQEAELGLLGRLNRLAGIEYPNDPALRARIRSYELAAGMQAAIPETLQLERETQGSQRLYGMDNATTRPFGQLCLAARRLVERGVRFVQLFHGGGGGGAWDSHANIRGNHASLCAQVDLPIAGLIRDLKQRGMLDETLVVWGTEFGRSPGAQGDGRDHHPQGFCAWLAGGGIKGGVVHGATDPIGFHAIDNRRYITDIHATVMHQLGLDARRLEVPGRRRLDIDYGRPIREIMA